MRGHFLWVGVGGWRYILVGGGGWTFFMGVWGVAGGIFWVSGDVWTFFMDGWGWVEVHFGCLG